MVRSIQVLAAVTFIAALMPSAAFCQRPASGQIAGEKERPDPQVAAQMSLGDAKEIIQKWIRWNYGPVAPIGGFEGTFEFTPGKIILIWYSSPPQTRYSCSYEIFDPWASSKTTILAQGAHQGESVYRVETGRHDGDGCFNLGLQVPDHEEALKVAAALLRWKNSTLAERQALPARELQAFMSVVSAYRASNPRPEIPEDVRRFRTIAETALQDKRPTDAIDAYDDGLKLAPWWTAGHFNDALALGALHYYDEAIEHMKKYILLMPDAPDAREVQDKIYAWEGERQSLWSAPRLEVSQPARHKQF